MESRVFPAWNEVSTPANAWEVVSGGACVKTWVVFVCAGPGGGSSDVQWCFSQVKGAMDDDVAEGKSLFYV